MLAVGTMAPLIIEAGRTERQYWRDLWRYRELFHVLAWRDISVRYKQTAVGILWAVLQPAATTAALVFTFGKIARLAPEGGVPMVLFVMAANLPYQFFSSSLSNASQSVINNASLISKVYFPRMIIPVGAMVAALADLAVAFGLLALVMLWYQFWPTWRLLTLPFFVLMAFAAALGPGLILTALTVRYRDFRYVLQLLLQFGFLICPVGYGISHIPMSLRPAFSLNPMVGVIDGFRWAILGGRTDFYAAGFVISLAVTIILMILGVLYFRRTERAFADLI
jgi:lipopolysaccharide transport system permease protein